MALFQVNRYMGQESQSEPQDSSDRLLQRLHDKAKAREKQRSEVHLKTTSLESKNKHDNDKKIQDDHGKVKLKKKKEKHQKSSAANNIDNQSEENEPKKRKHIDTEADDIQPSVEEKKKTKKHKRRKEKETEVQMSDLTKSGYSERTIEDPEERNQNSPKLKKKKHKDKKSKKITDCDSSPQQTQITQKHSKNSSKSKKKGKAAADTRQDEDDESNQKMEVDGSGKSSDEETETKLEKKKISLVDAKMDESSSSDEDDDEEVGTTAGPGIEQEENEDEEQDIASDGEEGETKEADVEEEDVGFTVLGGVEETSRKKVMRVLPEWLSHPTVVEHDLTHNKVDVDDYPLISTKIAAALKQNNITHLFPVQRHVIPIILDSVKFGLHAGNAGYRPRDVCVSAPTGSGKTLAFAVPVVQALHDRVVPRIRALAVLPTRDLASQVYRVFAMLCNAVNLRVVLLGGQKSFDKEQEMLSKHSHSDDIQIDIVVATPGRLVDHINNTKGFTLEFLRFLIIDEADRMMDEISKDWISQVEKSAYPGRSAPYGVASIVQARPKPGPVTLASCSQMHLPMQKLLFSATLSQNPEKLTHLNLFQPRLVTTLVTQGQQRRSQGHHEVTEGEQEETGEFVGKFTTPVGLTEFYIECSKADKPLVVVHLTKHLYCKQVLCFTNTVEATHRLYLLVKIIGGVNVAEFSSNLKPAERQQILKKFKAGKIDLLICSDAMARGMDIDNVRFVISYGLPPYLKTYIHRVGRTARAGKPGIAFSLLQKSEIPMFKSMLKNAGKTDIEKHIVRPGDLQPLMMDYEDALDQLPHILKKEKEKSWTGGK